MYVHPYLPRTQRDQTYVCTEGALLNLMDKLGQLGVSATAVVNLQAGKFTLTSESGLTHIIIYLKITFMLTSSP